MRSGASRRPTGGLPPGNVRFTSGRCAARVLNLPPDTKSRSRFLAASVSQNVACNAELSHGFGMTHGSARIFAVR